MIKLEIINRHDVVRDYAERGAYDGVKIYFRLILNFV